MQEYGQQYESYPEPSEPRESAIYLLDLELDRMG